MHHIEYAYYQFTFLGSFSFNSLSVDSHLRLRLPELGFLTPISLLNIAFGMVTLTPSSLIGLGVRANLPEERLRLRMVTINGVRGSNLGMVALEMGVMDTARLGRGEGGRIDRTFLDAEEDTCRPVDDVSLGLSSILEEDK